MIILQKYILREWFWAFLAVTLVLIVVLFGLSIGELLNDVAGGRVPPGLLGALLVLKMPDLLSKILPLAMFIAVIWGLGRLYRDQEMSVMRSSGFRWQMMLRPLSNLLFPVAALLLINGMYVAPKAAQSAQDKLENAFRTASEWGLQTGRFHVLQNGNLILYVETVEDDGRTLRNIFIQQRRDEREQIWVAEQGYYWLDADTGIRYLTMENGQITEGGTDTLDFGVVRYSRNDLRLPELEDSHKPAGVETRASTELIFSGLAEEAAEFQWRVSPALAIIVLGLLAIPLSHHEPREGRGGRIMLGILVYIIYANVLYMSRSWTANGALPVFLGTWWVHFLTLVIAVWWLRRQGRAA